MRDRARHSDFAIGFDNDVTLSVIISCLNEAHTFDAMAERTLATFDRMGVAAEIVAVDDGSTDATWAHIEAWGSRDARLRGVRHGRNRGIEAGWRSGLSAARGRLVCLIDGDLQNPPEEIARLLARYEAGGADLVQGTRRPVNPSRVRYVLSKGLNVILNRTFGMCLADNKSGFVLCPRDVLAAILEHRYSYRYFQAFIAVAAHARGFEIAEVDTPFHPRAAGESFLNNMLLRSIVGVLWDVLKMRAELCQALPPSRAARLSRRAPVSVEPVGPAEGI
jgi:phenylacetate-CoA ligase